MTETTQTQTETTFTETLRELLGKYDEKRAEWIAAFGTDAGYDKWFTHQVMRTG